MRSTNDKVKPLFKAEQFQSSVPYSLTVLSWVLRIQAQQALIVPGLYKEAQADILSPAPAPWFPNAVKPLGFWGLPIGSSAKH